MRDIFNGINGITVLKNEPLKKYCSFRIGGPAQYFIKVYNFKGLLEAILTIKRHRLRYIVLGAGTNILFRDEGFNGVVMKLMGDFRKIRNEGNRFICGGGALIRSFLKKALESGYGSAEFLVGIPGSIGGAIKGNAGAFGRSISELIEDVKVLKSDLSIARLKKDEMIFDYRYSSIQDNEIILEAELMLKRMDKKVIAKRMEEFLRLRWEKQPRGYSAGSFFKNPRPMSAGRLIEECGLKGYRVGDAVVSNKHANFIINKGRARAKDVIDLMRFIKRKVKKEKGIDLEPEVRII